jgi:hypothetical protein
MGSIPVRNLPTDTNSISPRLPYGMGRGNFPSLLAPFSSAGSVADASPVYNSLATTVHSVIFVQNKPVASCPRIGGQHEAHLSSAIIPSKSKRKSQRENWTPTDRRRNGGGTCHAIESLPCSCYSAAPGNAGTAPSLPRRSPAARSEPGPQLARSFYMRSRSSRVGAVGSVEKLAARAARSRTICSRCISRWWRRMPG